MNPYIFTSFVQFVHKTSYIISCIFSYSGFRLCKICSIFVCVFFFWTM